MATPPTRADRPKEPKLEAKNGLPEEAAPAKDLNPMPRPSIPGAEEDKRRGTEVGQVAKDAIEIRPRCAMEGGGGNQISFGLSGQLLGCG